MSRIITIGDSRTARNEWQPTLITGLNSAAPRRPSWSYRFNLTNLDTSVIVISQNIEAYLSESTWALSYPLFILMDFGEHDMVGTPGGVPNRTAFQNAYLNIIDTIGARWFSARFFLDIPWTVPLDGAMYTAFKGYVETVIAARAKCSLGVDQGITMKSNDMGATNMHEDGIHFSTAGNLTYAAAIQTAMGF